jgi:hypothetical protein
MLYKKYNRWHNIKIYYQQTIHCHPTETKHDNMCHMNGGNLALHSSNVNTKLGNIFNLQPSSLPDEMEDQCETNTASFNT